MQQVYAGLPVFGVQVIVHLKGTPPSVVAVGGGTVRTPLIPVTPAIQAAAALSLATRNLPEAVLRERQGSAFRQLQPRLGIYVETPFTGRPGSPRLAYEVEALGYITYVDALDGSILLQYDNLKTERSRETYTADGSASLPGTLLLTEAASCDSAGNAPDTASAAPLAAGEACRAHKIAGDVYDYFWKVHGRDSFDGAGGKLVSTVEYASSVCPNAGWTGSQIFYCAGFTLSEDAAAHELTHAVVDAGPGLIYLNQSGALNESYADVFAAMVDRGDWLIGEDLPGLPACGAVRNLADPPACGDPDHMDGYLTPAQAPCKGTSDEVNGCIHFNSGIPNKAAWLLAHGGTFHGVRVSGIGRAKLERIYFLALTRLTPGAQFSDAARETQRACSDLVGFFRITKANCAQVANAFRAVGIEIDPK
jgi:Zn-dependent metalloprotease